MKILVTTVTRSPRGNAMRASREIVAEQLRIGRGAECELRLADPRVPLHARTLMMGRNGPQMFDAADINADVTGVYRAQTLPPGTSLKLGPFQIDVTEPPPGTDLALTVELVQALPGKAGLSARDIYEQARRMPVSRRTLSWLLFTLILTGGLLLPVLGALQDTTPAAPARTALDRAQQAPGLQADIVWNPGELADGHQSFAGECKLCHSRSFTRVQDKDCRACHQDMGDHAAPTAAAASGLADVRCASCHQDHKGRLGLAQQISHYAMNDCSSCHGTLQQRLPGTAIQDAHDFATGHPEFRISFLSARLEHDDRHWLTRQRRDDNAPLVEQRGLKFPHQLHLDAKGVRSPRGLVKTDCASCHVPEANGLRFKPVSMAQHCQSCHELRFEPAAPERQLPHGDVDAVMTSLREFYSYLAVNRIALDRPPARLPATAARTVPGKTGSNALRLSGAADVERQVQQTAQEVFEKTTCFSCHAVTRETAADGTPHWRIAPVTPAPAWMPKARFSHASHTMSDCTTCHAAPTSQQAQDVLMPGIASCRSCHAGRDAAPRKLVSNCGLCHGFHTVGPEHPLPAAHPALPAAAPAGARP